jgi:hypothetical protein
VIASVFYDQQSWFTHMQKDEGTLQGVYFSFVLGGGAD